MSVVVSFVKTKGIGSVEVQSIGEVRARETLALNGTTTASVQAGEIVLVGNAETAMILVAFGTTPDAQATSSTSATSAGIPVPPGSIGIPLVPPVGAKINVKALA